MLPSELILAIEMERGELKAPPSIPLLDAPSLVPSILSVAFVIHFTVNAVQFYVLHIYLYRTLSKLQCLLFILVIYITVYLIFNLHDFIFLLDILVILFINFLVIYI